MPQPIIIAIDGPAGTGKSTIAKSLATKFKLTYIETGSIYRALAYMINKNHIDPKNTDAVLALIPHISWVIDDNSHKSQIIIDQEIIEHELRSENISNLASLISQHENIRKALLVLQRSLVSNITFGAIFEGRDIGTVVFPKADLKIYITADSNTRAMRRFLEQKKSHKDTLFADIYTLMQERDDRDQNRSVSPLIAAADAHIIDSSHKTIDQVIDEVSSFFTHLLAKKTMINMIPVRGMNDLFESDLLGFRFIEKTFLNICQNFGFNEIRTPILEDLSLFKRGVGETSDIVEKEMFMVKDGEHNYCLRPENTASVVRALINRGIDLESQEKLYYLGPMFRKERPQKGRLRQFHQLGVEIFGILSPNADIEILVMMDHFLHQLAIHNIKLKINFLGITKERMLFKDKLVNYLSKYHQDLCHDCQRRLTTNPLRTLDCKQKKCHDIAMMGPKIIDVLENDSMKYFEEVKLGLDHAQIAYEVDYSLVRGLDYYNKTVFEFVANEGLGAQNTVIAGGRYDGLFLTLGHHFDLPAIGCAAGIERLALLLKKDLSSNRAKISLLAADDQGQKQCMDLVFKLRKIGISADFSLVKKSLKAQMRRADKLKSQFIAIIGDKEIKNGRINIKNLDDKTQRDIPLSIEALSQFFSLT